MLPLSAATHEQRSADCGTLRAALRGAHNPQMLQVPALYFSSVLRACLYTAQGLNLGSHHVASALISY